MVSLVFYKDSRGRHCARGNDLRLATFLETDLQESIQQTNHVIELLVTDNSEAEFRGSHHCVKIGLDWVEIHPKFVDNAPVRTISRRELLENIRHWLAFLTTDEPGEYQCRD